MSRTGRRWTSSGRAAARPAPWSLPWRGTGRQGTSSNSPISSTKTCLKLTLISLTYQPINLYSQGSRKGAPRFSTFTHSMPLLLACRGSWLRRTIRAAGSFAPPYRGASSQSTTELTPVSIQSTTNAKENTWSIMGRTIILLLILRLQDQSKNLRITPRKTLSGKTVAQQIDSVTRLRCAKVGVTTISD